MDAFDKRISSIVEKKTIYQISPKEREMKSTVDVVVNKPLDEVWEYVSNVENMDKWVDGVSEPKLTSNGEFGVGSTFWSKYTYGNQTHEVNYKVTDFNPPHSMTTVSTSGPFPFEGVIRLEPVDGGVRVFNTVDAGSDSLFTTLTFILLRPLVSRMMKKQLRKELTALKGILESTPSREKA